MPREPLGADYRQLWRATAISNLGDGVFLVTFPLLAASVSRDPIAVSAVTLALTVPWVLFALVSGALVDRWDRLVVMRRVDVIRAVLTATLALVVLLRLVTIPGLIGFAFLLGTAETMFDTASLAAVPSIVGPSPDRLHAANARLENARLVANDFVGPPVGGALFALTPALPAIVDAVSFLASTLLLHRIPTREGSPRPAARSTIHQEITEGLRWLWTQPILPTLAAVVGIINLGFMAATTVLVLLLDERTDVGSFGYGLILGLGAVGAVAGNLLAERFGRRLPLGLTLGATTTLIGAALTTIAIRPTAPVITACFAAAGCAGAVWNVLTVSLRQTVIPGPLLGRVNSVYRLVAYGTMPAGALLGGTIASSAGLTAPFLMAGILVLATTPIVIAIVTPAALSALHPAE
jgi:MFS family permease